MTEHVLFFLKFLLENLKVPRGKTVTIVERLKSIFVLVNVSVSVISFIHTNFTYNNFLNVDSRRGSAIEQKQY